MKRPRIGPEQVQLRAAVDGQQAGGVNGRLLQGCALVLDRAQLAVSFDDCLVRRERGDRAMFQRPRIKPKSLEHDDTQNHRGQRRSEMGVLLQSLVQTGHSCLSQPFSGFLGSPPFAVASGWIAGCIDRGRAGAVRNSISTDPSSSETWREPGRSIRGVNTMAYPVFRTRRHREFRDCDGPCPSPIAGRPGGKDRPSRRTGYAYDRESQPRLSDRGLPRPGTTANGLGRSSWWWVTPTLRLEGYSQSTRGRAGRLHWNGVQVNARRLNHAKDVVFSILNIWPDKRLRFVQTVRFTGFSLMRLQADGRAYRWVRL